MTDPTPRQVLYGLVAGGFLVVVTTLVIAAAVAELVPIWWTAIMTALVVASASWIAFHWRRTMISLSLTIGLFIVWTVGTLTVS